MKKLLVYVSITRDPLPLVPDELIKLESEELRVADIDQKSGIEVRETVYSALETADEVILIVQVDDTSEDISNLFGLFKRLIRIKSSVIWLQLGHHPQLKIFQQKLTPQFLSAHAELMEDVRKICAQ